MDLIVQTWQALFAASLPTWSVQQLAWIEALALCAAVRVCERWAGEGHNAVALRGLPNCSAAAYANWRCSGKGQTSCGWFLGVNSY